MGSGSAPSGRRVGPISRARLREIATGSAASVIVGTVAGNGLRLVSNLILTRLLLPEAFGITAIITSIQFTISLLSDVGFYDFIVQHEDGGDPRFRDEVWSIRLVRGAMLTIAMLLIAYPAAWLLHKPLLGPVIAVWSLGFLLDGLSSLSWATAVREHQFWRLSCYELITSTFGSIVSVILALLFRSYWALIGGMGATALAMALLSYLMFPGSARRWRFRPERMRELWGFSRYIAMGSVVTLILMQADKFLLARMMPLGVFGLYGVASTLASAPTQLALGYTSRVLLAAYADAARAGRDVLRATFYKRRRKVGLLYMAAAGLAIGGGPLVIAILYRPNYYSVTPYFQLLMISAALRYSSNSGKWALIALGKTAANFYTQLWAAAWLIVGGAISIAAHNILWLVAVIGTVELPGLLATWFYLRREQVLNLRAEALELAAAIVGGGAGWLLSDVALQIWPKL